MGIISINTDELRHRLNRAKIKTSRAVVVAGVAGGASTLLGEKHMTGLLMKAGEDGKITKGEQKRLYKEGFSHSAIDQALEAVTSNKISKWEAKAIFKEDFKGLF